MTTPTVTREDVQEILGPLDDLLIAEILALDPTRSELAEAKARAIGQDDVSPFAENRHAVVASIVDMIEVEEEAWDEGQEGS